METQQLNRILDALVHPARRVILEQLGETSLTAGELARPFGLDLPAISLHLSILERAGLIVRDGDDASEERT